MLYFNVKPNNDICNNTNYNLSTFNTAFYFNIIDYCFFKCLLKKYKCTGKIQVQAYFGRISCMRLHRIKFRRRSKFTLLLNLNLHRIWKPSQLVIERRLKRIVDRAALNGGRNPGVVNFRMFKRSDFSGTANFSKCLFCSTCSSLHDLKRNTF